MSSPKLKKYFKGKMVGVITRSIRGTQKTGGDVFTGNHVIEGIYADEDMDYIYLANHEGSMVEALYKKDVVRVFIPNELEDVGEVPENFN